MQDVASQRLRLCSTTNRNVDAQDAQGDELVMATSAITSPG